jgi:hypothetical protein
VALAINTTTARNASTAGNGTASNSSMGRPELYILRGPNRAPIVHAVFIPGNFSKGPSLATLVDVAVSLVYSSASSAECSSAAAAVACTATFVVHSGGPDAPWEVVAAATKLAAGDAALPLVLRGISNATRRTAVKRKRKRVAACGILC